MWHRKQVYWGCYAGEDERKMSCDNFTATYKGDTEQTCRENETGKIYNDQIKTHAILLKDGATHSDTHSDENKPRCMAKDLLQPEREVS